MPVQRRPEPDALALGLLMPEPEGYADGFREATDLARLELNALRDHRDRMESALRWLAARLDEGSTPDRAWAAVVKCGLTGEPDDALAAYEEGKRV